MPSNATAAETLILDGFAPSAIHNNCSGKHAGFICFGVHSGFDVHGYVEPDHPVQQAVTDILSDMTDTKLDASVRGVDGCSIPTYAIPLDKIALGYARFVTGEGLSPGRRSAAQQLCAACRAEPFLIAGSGRFCTDTLTRFGDRLIVKTGAEGVFCAGLPALGLGVAVKCDDGAGRAAETIIANVIGTLLRLTETEREGYADRLEPPIFSRRGARVGSVRMADGVVAAVAGAMA
jgi:L-asparaginase II